MSISPNCVTTFLGTGSTEVTGASVMAPSYWPPDVKGQVLGLVLHILLHICYLLHYWYQLIDLQDRNAQFISSINIVCTHSHSIVRKSAFISYNLHLSHTIASTRRGSLTILLKLLLSSFIKYYNLLSVQKYGKVSLVDSVQPCRLSMKMTVKLVSSWNCSVKWCSKVAKECPTRCQEYITCMTSESIVLNDCKE